jgi:hypothetical protein
MHPLGGRVVRIVRLRRNCGILNRLLALGISAVRRQQALRRVVKLTHSRLAPSLGRGMRKLNITRTKCVCVPEVTVSSSVVGLLSLPRDQQSQIAEWRSP